MEELLLIGLIISLDNLRVSFGLGALDLSPRRRILLPLLFGLFEGLMPLLGLIIGKSLVVIVGEWMEWIGALALLGTGVLVLYESFDSNNDDHSLVNSNWIVLGLPLSLSLDNLLAGIGLASLDFPLVFSAIVVGVFSGGMAVFGVWIGGRLRQFLSQYASIAGGTALILFVVFEIVIDI